MSKGKKEIQPHWRPNFVDPAELPDIKVIRTDFIINFIAVTLALVVMFSLLQREYKARIVSQGIDAMEQRIAIAEAKDKESLKLSSDFRKAAEHIVEVEKFFEAPIQPHEFLLGLSEIKPDDLLFSSISFSEQITKVKKKDQVSYAINISGDARSLTVLDDFKSVLANGALLNIDGFGLEISETLQGRNAETGIFPFRLAVLLAPGDEKSKGGDDS